MNECMHWIKIPDFNNQILLDISLCISKGIVIKIFLTRKFSYEES